MVVWNYGHPQCWIQILRASNLMRLCFAAVDGALEYDASSVNVRSCTIDCHIYGQVKNGKNVFGSWWVCMHCEVSVGIVQSPWYRLLSIYLPACYLQLYILSLKAKSLKSFQKDHVHCRDQRVREFIFRFEKEQLIIVFRSAVCWSCSRCSKCSNMAKVLGVESGIWAYIPDGNLWLCSRLDIRWTDCQRSPGQTWSDLLRPTSDSQLAR